MNDKLDEDKLYDKFKILYEEAKKSLNLTLKNSYLQTEELSKDHFEYAKSKIDERCHDSKKKFFDVSEREEMLDMETSKLTYKFLPKKGMEKEYELFSAEYKNCSMPFVTEIETIFYQEETLEKFVEKPYQLCISDCYDYVVKSSQEGNLYFDNVKRCLKDCNNLFYFNYKVSDDVLLKQIEMSNARLDKL